MSREDFFSFLTYILRLKPRQKKITDYMKVAKLPPPLSLLVLSSVRLSNISEVNRTMNNSPLHAAWLKKTFAGGSSSPSSSSNAQVY